MRAVPFAFALLVKAEVVVAAGLGEPPGNWTGATRHGGFVAVDK